MFLILSAKLLKINVITKINHIFSTTFNNFYHIFSTTLILFAQHCLHVVGKVLLPQDKQLVNYMTLKFST